jgi:flagellar protein FlaG
MKTSGSAEPLEKSEEPGRIEEPELVQAVNRLNDLVQTIRRELKFTVDEQSGRTVIKVIDTETDEVIRQIPPEEVLSLISHFRDLEGGLLQVQA